MRSSGDSHGYGRRDGYGYRDNYDRGNRNHGYHSDYRQDNYGGRQERNNDNYNNSMRFRNANPYGSRSPSPVNNYRESMNRPSSWNDYRQDRQPSYNHRPADNFNEYRDRAQPNSHYSYREDQPQGRRLARGAFAQRGASRNGERRDPPTRTRVFDMNGQEVHDTREKILTIGEHIDFCDDEMEILRNTIRHYAQHRKEFVKKLDQLRLETRGFIVPPPQMDPPRMDPRIREDRRFQHRNERRGGNGTGLPARNAAAPQNSRGIRGPREAAAPADVPLNGNGELENNN